MVSEVRGSIVIIRGGARWCHFQMAGCYVISARARAIYPKGVQRVMVHIQAQATVVG